MDNRTPKERFDVRVSKDGPTMPHMKTCCWLWTGAIVVGGYGMFPLNGKSVRAHRASYEMYKGSIPKGMWVLHRCDNPPCVRGGHLFIGTNQDNMKDMIRKGRKPRGNNNPLSKLTEEKVRTMRSRYAKGWSIARLAKKYVVNWTTADSAVKGRTWRYVK